MGTFDDGENDQVKETRPFRFLLAPTIAGGEPDRLDRAEPLRRYLEGVLGQPVEMAVADDYGETMAALRAGDADAAMMGDYATRQAEQAGGAEPLVAPMGRDEAVPTYRSAVVTRIDSGLHDLPSLRGGTFGLVDVGSTSGYLVPRAMLREAGIDPDTELDVRLIGSHRAVVEAVIAGEVQAGAAHESRLRPRSLDDGPGYARLRVLARSRPIPLGPLVVRTTLDPATRNVLATALLRVHEADPQAAQVVIRAGHRFTVAAPRSATTLKSIAALAGVSYATVSRVVNGGDRVAPETARRVEAIIRETGYVPNGNARLLQGQQTPLIGLLARLDPAAGSPPLDLIAQAMDALTGRGIPMVVCPIEASLGESLVPELLRDRRLGALLVTADHLDDPDLAELARTGFAVIAIDVPAVPQGMIATSLDALGATVAAVLGVQRSGQTSSASAAGKISRSHSA